MYATSYLYNSSEFIELLLSQPVTRTKIWTSLYFVLTVALSLACILGIGIPLVFFSLNTTGAMLLLTGVLITMIFVAFAMVATVLTRDKAKGIGLSIILWLFFSLFFDGLMLFFVFQFSDYPIEKLMLGASLLNPISISRNLILLQLDISAIMGYTGAIFKAFFGTTLGIFFSFTILLLWAIIPFIFSLRRFKSKDL
jgi:Cu-processing system permease protein